MLTVYSNDHQLHRGGLELSGGELVPCFECPERADLVLAAVHDAGLGDIVEPRDFGLDPLLRVHDARFLQFLQEAWDLWSAAGRSGSALAYSWAIRDMQAQEPEHVDGKLGYFSFDATSPIGSGTWRAAKTSANTALSGAAALLDGDACVFSLCRPPGHHAARDYFGGYCYLNNVAIAAQYLRDQRAAKVAILDVDYHHGNGTQSIFYDRDDVLFVSIHGDPDQEFPFFLGRRSETGSGAGRGYNVNLPLRWHSSSQEWFAALDQATAIVADFAPDYLLVSLGVDTYIEDPISKFRLLHEDYLIMGAKIAALGLPMQFVLEGGYAVGDIGVNVANVLRAASRDSAQR
ncbi:MAG: histone deacetylase family protein [Gammaproteobacteria bacterium]|nr:histone deacetylase family protein [Gammaproteobacteria bacterium]MDH5303905.1 histone deacetylase family protein [Gammaproteobacteria bacterium]MDH5321799.1 histone deacetylase family protein [Gammaproteobacteria bacterium]